MKKVVRLSLLAVLTAIIILMAFTPIGYLRTPLFEITFITIPVAVGAIALGPVSGGILGGVFGVTSYIQCFLGSPLGTPLLAINPLFAGIVCIVPRVLIGVIGGLVYKSFKTDKIYAGAIASFSVAISNTILFLGSLIALYYNTDLIQGMMTDMAGGSLVGFIVVLVGIGGLVEMAVCTIVSAPVSKSITLLQKRYNN